MTRRPANLTPQTERTSADAAIIALARLLARQAAAEVLAGVSPDPEDHAHGQSNDPGR